MTFAPPRPFHVSERDKVYLRYRFQLPARWQPSFHGIHEPVRFKVTHGLPDFSTVEITPGVVMAHALVQALERQVIATPSRSPAETFAEAVALMEAHVRLRRALGLPISPFVPSVAVHCGAKCYGVVRPG
jgi:hypothetical protein